jgi:hypothetical protein
MSPNNNTKKDFVLSKFIPHEDSHESQEVKSRRGNEDYEYLMKELKT